MVKGTALERRQAERIKLLEGVIERYALALMKIRTSQGDPIQIARDTMNAEQH